MEKEPKMDIIKEADEKNDVGGIAKDRLRSLIEREWNVSKKRKVRWPEIFATSSQRQKALALTLK